MRLLAGTEWEQAPLCERCGELLESCKCAPVAQLPRKKGQATPASQTVGVQVEKRKRGKLMTVVRGLAASENDLPGLLSQLKNLCGAGGTVKDDQIEIQGDHLRRIWLSSEKIAE